MLILYPRRVTFGESSWDEVVSIAIDRSAARAAVEWSDRGPHPVFADAPEQRTTITVRRAIARDEPDAPRPGDLATLAFETAHGATDAARRRISASAVVLDVSHDLSRRDVTRTVRLLALSPDGAADPVTTT